MDGWIVPAFAQLIRVSVSDNEWLLLLLRLLSLENPKTIIDENCTTIWTAAAAATERTESKNEI